jgi:hypothetical protein
MSINWPNFRPVPDVVGVMLGAASGAFIGWHFALQTAFVCADSGTGAAPLLYALFFTGAAVWLGIVWVTAVRKTSIAASMPDCLSCLWWGGLGSIVGGWSSALLADHALLTPALVLLKNPGSATGLAAVAAPARVMVLAGILMGAASGVCLAWHLYLHPSKKRDLVAGWLSALLGIMLLPGLEVFSGTVAGLRISTTSVTIIRMDVLTSNDELFVPVGKAVYCCGPRHGTCYASFRDGSVVVAVRHSTYFYRRR